ncbi:MAG: cupredoxin domain-containing protein [Nanoarchaeota archaeon]|nr:cupredoxin domain-containing protein [Nanoarchaeota archaeon]
MEQKQLDDLEDSFFGEEFIEDLEDLPPAAPSQSQDLKIESREQPTELRLQKALRKTSSPAVKKSAVKKSEKSAAVKPKETMLEEKEKPSLAGKVHEAKEHKEKKNLEPAAKKEIASVSIKPAKESVKDAVKETKPAVETSSPVNPWEEDDHSSGLFKETSTWKALTGIALVLLVLSLFTQGFNFSEKDTVTGAATVNLPEAEQKVLEYVNTQLLQAPFQAEVQSSEELDTLYRVTLAVAGQVVDSYVTKDGKLFFPQGLNLDEDVPGREVEVKPNPKELDVEVEAETEKLTPSEPELAPEVEEPREMEESTKSVDEPAVGEALKLTLNAKKWVFQPTVLRVKKGSKVVLTVVPTGLDFTFAVPGLGIEQKVAGTTDVVFTADKAGTFDFTCGSCEDWRGMRGNLVVESSK